MSEDPNTSSPPVAHAWACASVRPIYPGSPGVSASGWCISFDRWATVAGEKTPASRAANRNQWLAGIMAIIGVLEDVTEGSIVTVYVPNERLAHCYRTKWMNSDGKPAAEAEAAQGIFRLRADKGLTVFVEHRAKDAVYDSLQSATQAAAILRHRDLAAAGQTPALPTTPLRAKKSGRLRFPPAGEGGGA